MGAEMTAVAGAVTSSHERREVGRRERRVSLRYPERRTGFDRRDSSRYQLAMAGFQSDPRAIAGVLGLVLLLNAMDLILTLQALRLGATEANPVMAWLFDQDLLLASSFKLGLGTAVAITIWRLRRYRRVLELSLVLAGVFVLVVGYHLAGQLLVT
jgi:hypothetical protein